MTARGTFQFNGFTLRPAGEDDLELAKEWNAADDDHAVRVPARFWIEQDKGEDAYLLLDKAGPLFFFKLCTAAGRTVEMHVQFERSSTVDQRNRNAKGMLEGWKWLERMLAQVQIDKVLFASRSAGLILFCQRRLGFILEGAQLPDGSVILLRTIANS